MITRSATIADIDDLNLMWNDHINASALYRHTLRDEMEVRGVDPDELRDLLERARKQGYIDEIAENTTDSTTISCSSKPSNTSQRLETPRMSNPLCHRTSLPPTLSIAVKTSYH